MKITVLTLFPHWFDGPFGESILGRAQAAGLVALQVRNLRDWAHDKHKCVDDAPYGGGGGMLLKVEPVAAALDEVAGPPGASGRARVLYTSPKGFRWDQERAKYLASAGGDLVILCGHYEGIDERLIETRIDEEVSLGDFVMTGGEAAALAIVDSIVRLLPGALGTEDAAQKDSFYEGLLEGPHYTRPPVFEGREVPPVLLSGNHAAVEQWRHEMAVKVTQERRPDLLEKWAEEHPPVVKKLRRRRD